MGVWFFVAETLYEFVWNFSTKVAKWVIVYSYILIPFYGTPTEIFAEYQNCCVQLVVNGSSHMLFQKLLTKHYS